MADGQIFVNPFAAMHEGVMNLTGEALARQAVAKGDIENRLLQQQLALPGALASIGSDTIGSPQPIVDPITGTVLNTGDMISRSAPTGPAPGTAAPGIPEFWRFDMDAAQKQQQIANVYRKYGQYKLAEESERIADAALGRAATAQKESFDQNQKRLDTMSTAIGNVKGPEDIGPMLSVLARYQPDLIKNSPFQRDLVSGDYLWDTTNTPGQPSNKDLVKAMANSTLSQKTQAEIQNYNSEVVNRQREREQQEKEIAERQRHNQKEEALQQAGLSLHADDITERRAERVQLRENRFIDSTQKSLDNDPAIKSFEKYDTGYSTAKQVADQLASPKGYEAVTTANASALASAFFNMKEDYRARIGGSSQTTQMKSLDGVYQKIQKFATTIGEGDKQVAAGTMAEVINAMNGLYYNKNAQIVKQELQAIDVLKNRVPDATPNDLRLRGNLDLAVKTGQAKVIMYNGKRYALFGTSPKDQFELPDGM